MTPAGNNVFLIGPGYIGREVIDRLLENGYTVTTLVRRKEAVQELEEAGVKTVMGTIDDAAIITEYTAKSDIVFHIATADHLDSVNAVIAGIEQRASKGLFTTFIHTSGTGTLGDDSNGEYVSDNIYSDRKPVGIDALPDSAPHRNVDLAIIKARNRLGDKAKIFIMLPPLIYGATQHGRLSIQVITMARFAIKHGYAGFAGKGKAVWCPIHIKDLSYGYWTMLQWLEKSPPEVALEHPYFFCENGTEISWGDCAAFVGEELHAAGKLYAPMTKEIPEDHYDDLFGIHTVGVIGANSRNRADRLRDLGWQPKEMSIKEAFQKEELPILLKETAEFNGYARAVASGPK